MPDKPKKESVLLDDLALQVVGWLIAILLGVLIFFASHSWEIALVVTYFFRRLDMLARR